MDNRSGIRATKRDLTLLQGESENAMKKLPTKPRPVQPVRPLDTAALAQIRGGVDGVKDHSI